MLYSFCKAKIDCNDGAEPVGSLVMDNRGNFYGTTLRGGPIDSGVLFKVTPAGKETVLHHFCSLSGCADGAWADGSLILDRSGNLYGTAGHDSAGGGVVFELTHAGHYIVLYDFCSVSGCADGTGPNDGLVIGRSGNLYGTTIGGGANGAGTIFEITATGEEVVLHSFCSDPSTCSDGSGPNGGLVMDKSESLYGVTREGGQNNGGTVFKISKDGTYIVLYSFCSAANCADGSAPFGALVRDGSGNLYGTTGAGGEGTEGTVFKIASGGEERVLHSFCPGGGKCATLGPNGGLIIGSFGELFGTTAGVPRLCFRAHIVICDPGVRGSIFKLTLPG